MSANRDWQSGVPLLNSGDPLAGARGVPLSRRVVLQRGLVSAAGVLVADRLGFAAEASPSPKTPAKASPTASTGAKAKAVIQIWMWGGPSHIDTFDPKPEAGTDYCGPYTTPIKTNVDGIRICETLPELAKQADKYSIIRGMTHGQNGHETAAYLTQTGRMPGGRLVYPTVGAVVSLFKGVDHGYKGLLPPYIVLTQPQGRFSEAGFLGVRYKPFATGSDPNAGKFAVEGVVAPGISDEQQQSRRGLLNQLNTLGRAAKGDPQLALSQQAEKQAYDLILGDAGRVFDLSREKNELRQEYGRNTFGQACLVARRLVERGVRFITINYNAGWDSHKEHFQAMRRLLPQFDRGFATLLKDLAEHNLLDSTIVWCGGEFGRTPKIAQESPWNGGRHHFGAVFSHVVAGGGFKGGKVVGSSNAKGEEVMDRPVYPRDLIAGMYELLDIDPDGAMTHPLGERVPLTPTLAEDPKTGGRLKEIL